MMIPMLVKKKSQRDLSSIQLGSAVFVPDMEKKTGRVVIYGDIMGQNHPTVA